MILLRFDRCHQAPGWHRAGVLPVSLPRLQQVVQRAPRWTGEPNALPIRRHRRGVLWRLRYHLTLGDLAERFLQRV